MTNKSRTGTKPDERKNKPVEKEAKVSHSVPFTAPAPPQKSTTVSNHNALIKKPKSVNVTTKIKVPKQTSKNKITQSVTSSSSAINTNTNNNNSNNNKPIKRRKLIPKLKKLTIVLHKPKIQTPVDILELYSNPLFSFAFPERQKIPRTTPMASVVTSAAPVQPETQHALFHAENEDHEEEEDEQDEDEQENEEDEQVDRKRPPVTLSHSPPPRREAKKARQSPKRAKKSNNKHRPTVPVSMEDALTNLPKGVTKRPSGRWVSAKQKYASDKEPM